MGRKANLPEWLKQKGKYYEFGKKTSGLRKHTLYILQGAKHPICDRLRYSRINRKYVCNPMQLKSGQLA